MSALPAGGVSRKGQGCGQTCSDQCTKQQHGGRHCSGRSGRTGPPRGRRLPLAEFCGSCFSGANPKVKRCSPAWPRRWRVHWPCVARTTPGWTSAAAGPSPLHLRRKGAGRARQQHTTWEFESSNSPSPQHHACCHDGLRDAAAPSATRCAALPYPCGACSPQGAAAAAAHSRSSCWPPWWCDEAPGTDAAMLAECVVGVVWLLVCWFRRARAARGQDVWAVQKCDVLNGTWR